ncbi:MAG: phosphate/phosphite/phosphonate ABC transporter substrate-binding protein [Chloroflexi bacterium]|nr:phosphate/phosphite/phosphonate ABC transporter substrate-binding protein [Chloroflexota bacterium]
MSDAAGNAAPDPYRVGAVAYRASVVTIWEAFRRWFGERGFPLEYVLFATYEEQVRALRAGWIDVAWNTNLAYVATLQATAGGCRPIAMRDTDLGWTSHVIVPDQSPAAGQGLAGLRGRRVGFGDSDSPQAWILPAHAMRRAGFDPLVDFRAERLDRDLGKHGDTGGAEFEQLERLRSGLLDACVVSDPTWTAVREAGADQGLAIAWTSPPFNHCNFTVLDESRADHATFVRLLFSMSEDDPQIREPMRLEYVHRWVEPELSGYRDLIAAMGA